MARIILIDDEDAVRRTVRLALITDIFMPGQDGIVTVRRIRKEAPGVKVIAVSGGDSTGRLDLRKDAELLGAATSLRKPFSSADLLREIGRASCRERVERGRVGGARDRGMKRIRIKG